MALTSTHLNKEGKAGCISCRKTTFITDLQDCVGCGRFVCKSCATYRRQGNPYGHVCKACYQKLKN